MSFRSAVGYTGDGVFQQIDRHRKTNSSMRLR